uniref:CNNM transmembrane domain-containing protein n=1 Tax=Trichuris muris TaxID=70415 RepID=A0A5S6Q8Q2_TRIMR
MGYDLICLFHTRQAVVWNKLLLSIKRLVEAKTQLFNFANPSCIGKDVCFQAVHRLDGAFIERSDSSSQFKAEKSTSTCFDLSSCHCRRSYSESKLLRSAMGTLEGNGTTQYVVVGNFVVVCDLLNHAMLNCNGIVFERFNAYSMKGREFWLYVGAYLLLSLLSGYLSCLILAISSVDVTTVRVIWRTGKKSDKILASRMFMIIRRYHQVIVTLVAVNASAVETMPLVLDRISNPIVAIIITCLVILLFDEILPLVVCQTHGLSLGACSAYIILLLNYLFYPLSFPLGYLLDVFIGKDVGHLYRRQELKELISRHGPRRDHFQSLFEKEKRRLTEPTQFSGQLSSMEVQVMRGILELSKKTVADALVPLDKVFMVEYNEEMTKEFILKVLRSAHRHIPVYSCLRSNVVCSISTKRVLRVDPNSHIPVHEFIRSMSLTPSECLSVFIIPENQPLFDVIRKFRMGSLPRLAFVVKMDRRKVVEVIGTTSQQDVLKAIFAEKLRQSKRSKVPSSSTTCSMATTDKLHAKHSHGKLYES